MHSATIKTNLTRAEGKNIIVFITYTDGAEHSHPFECSLSDTEILTKAREIAKTRVDELNKAEEVAEEIRNHIEITIT